MARLDGRVAFITGVARGQGRSHAVRLAQEGADIIGMDVLKPVTTMSYAMGSQDDLDETVRLVEATGRRILVRQGDVRDRDEVRGAVEDGVREFGRLDIVAANAGVSPPGYKLWEIPPEQWADVIDINLTGVYNTLSCVVPPMLEAGNGGSIVVTSSGAGLKGVPHMGDYNATKHAVIGLAKTLANELARHDIRVNVLCPGTVDTPMVTENLQQFRVFRPDLENPVLEDTVEIFKRIMPMGRPWIDVADVSNALVFLCCDEARFITGVTLPVDQGSANRAV